MRKHDPVTTTIRPFDARIHRRSLLRFAVYSAIATVAAACAGERPGWTFAPPPPTPAASPPSGSPGGPAASPSGPATSPSPSPGGGAVEIRIVAENIRFDLTEFSVPPNTPFRIVFENRDAAIPHNVAIYQGQAGGATLFKGDTFNGAETRTYEVPGLAAGDHYFQCDVHPTMNGTVKVA